MSQDRPFLEYNLLRGDDGQPSVAAQVQLPRDLCFTAPREEVERQLGGFIIPPDPLLDRLIRAGLMV
jgi:hypothetical protein